MLINLQNALNYYNIHVVNISNVTVVFLQLKKIKFNIILFLLFPENACPGNHVSHFHPKRQHCWCNG